MEQQLKPRVGRIEGWLMLAVCLFFDGIDMLATYLDLILGAGEVVKLLNNIIASAILLIWGMMRDMRPLWLVAGGMIEFVPLGNALPIRTATMGIALHLDRNPAAADAAAALPTAAGRAIKRPRRGAALVAAAVFALSAHAAYAAESAIITWRAETYTPDGYEGRAFPVGRAPIRLAATLTADGALAPTANREFRWYVNGAFAAGGTNLRTLALQAPMTGEDKIEVRVSVARDASQTTDAFADIPIRRPEIVINTLKLPLVEPLFYFWNVAAPSFLKVSYSGELGRVSVRATNPKNPLEFAEAAHYQEPLP